MRSAMFHANVFLPPLLKQARRHPKLRTRVHQLCDLLEHYKGWDTWRSHPYCFLTTEEVYMVHRYLHYGSVTAIVQAVEGGATYIQTVLGRAIRKLEAGRADYEMVWAYLRSGKPLYDWDIPTIILNRPFVLFGFSTQLTNCLLRSNYNNFLEMEEGQGISDFLSKVYGIGAGGIEEIRREFERYDIHGLLLQHQVGSEDAYLKIVTAGRTTGL